MYPASPAPLSDVNATTNWPGGFPILGGKRSRKNMRKNSRKSSRKSYRK
jgi:hypothetical protein